MCATGPATAAGFVALFERIVEREGDLMAYNVHNVLVDLLGSARAERLSLTEPTSGPAVRRAFCSPRPCPISGLPRSRVFGDAQNRKELRFPPAPPDVSPPLGGLSCV